MGLLAMILIAVGGLTAGRSATGAAPSVDPRVLVTFPGAYDQILTFILGLGGMFAIIYGATVAGSEWSWGTLKSAVARGESRRGYMLLTFASIAVMVTLGLMLTFLVGILAALVASQLAGISTNGIADAAALGRLPNELARAACVLIEEGALGFAIATVARSQLAGIGVGIALYFGESFAALFLPDIVRYLPFDVAKAAVTTGASQGSSFGGIATGALGADTALLLVGVWLAGALAVMALFTERADITG
jgi:hypothetical protein